MKISILLGQCLDYFITDALYKNDDERYRARILAACLLSIAGISALTLATINLAYLGAPNNYIGIYLTISIFILFIILAFILKKTGRTTLIAQCLALPLLISLIIGSYVSGGAEASSSQILFIIPLMMFFTCGMRQGLIWTLIVLATQALIYGLYWTDFPFENHMTHKQAIEQSLVHWLVALAGIVGIALIYEKANIRLVSERDSRTKDNRHLSQRDLLTGLFNRSHCFVALNQLLHRTKRQKQNTITALLNIDNLTDINRIYGYEETDTILKSLASRMQSNAEFELLARIDGCKFILAATIGANKPDNIVQELRATISRPFNVGHEIVTLRFSIQHLTTQSSDNISAAKIISNLEYQLHLMTSNS